MNEILRAKIAHNYGYEVDEIEIIHKEWRFGIWMVIILIINRGEYVKIKIDTSNWQMHVV